MFDFEFTEWVVVGLVFVLGWLLGMASRDGGGRYKRELADERRMHETYRRDQDTRFSEMERNRPAGLDRRDDTLDRRPVVDERHADRRPVVEERDAEGRTVIRPTRP